MKKILFSLLLILTHWEPIVARDLISIMQPSTIEVSTFTKDHSTDPTLFTEITAIDLNEDDELTFNEKKQVIDQKQLNQFFDFYSNLPFIAQKANSSKSLLQTTQPLFLLKCVFLI